MRTPVVYDGPMRALLVVVAVLSACHREKAYDLGHDLLAIQASRFYVEERCAWHPASDGQTSDPPSTHEVALGSARVVQQCGLVYNEVYAPAFQARFAREVCGAADGTTDEA